jgi:hypothetical protein
MNPFLPQKAHCALGNGRPLTNEQNGKVDMWDVVFTPVLVIGDVIDDPIPFDMDAGTLQIERTLTIRDQ